MSPKEFNRQNKGILLEIVRRSNVMSPETAAAMTLPELRKALIDLWATHEAILTSIFKEVTAEAAAGAVFKPRRAGRRPAAEKNEDTTSRPAPKKPENTRSKTATPARSGRPASDQAKADRQEKGRVKSAKTKVGAEKKTVRPAKTSQQPQSDQAKPDEASKKSKTAHAKSEQIQEKKAADHRPDRSGKRGHFRETGTRPRKSGGDDKNEVTQVEGPHQPTDLAADQTSDQERQVQINDQPGVNRVEQEVYSGVLELMPDGYGFLRTENYIQSNHDIYIPPQFIRRFNLRSGDLVAGPCKNRRETDRYRALSYIYSVNDLPPEQVIRRPRFEQLTPIYPSERFVLETGRSEYSTRIIDLMAPIGKGQRGMIVSPPKAGKTVLLKKVANAITTNSADVHLMVLLIDERPEEVTDMQRSIDGEVIYSTFDKSPENHVSICELVLERAMRLVELGRDVVILMDSITRLARAYNLTINPTGRTLSGGLDPGALYGPKRFFGAARNIENGGSLTIVATSLVETGSRMDEVIFEEFKGTGNMEVYLDRKLSEKRIFPAIDITRSGTRREDLLLSNDEKDAVWSIRRALGNMDASAVTETVIGLLKKTNNNAHFVSSINVSLNEKSLQNTMNPKKQMGGNQGIPTGG